MWKDDFDHFDETKWGYQLYDGCQYGVCNWGNGEMVSATHLGPAMVTSPAMPVQSHARVTPC